eukprot:CAMPEP_0114511874 /NCGR_PEP_ID=MMETSP0109-20121206/14649_1 /TAXON_ID=29199 /ORGANISM="Chlorarachnion reptans, Strain CCCM449" /LENGTH=560 /DNA_ID=CAMNT_0001691469 /DNA_START=214 /DNA_END=1896 /DNA_ORIENTATION=+
MGRKKIEIKALTSVKGRQVTFNKRRVGLMKKAMELSVLCGCEVGLVVLFDRKMHVYASSPLEGILRRYHDYEGSYELLTNKDREHLRPGHSSSFKINRQKTKQRRIPCRLCGCHQAGCGPEFTTAAAEAVANLNYAAVVAANAVRFSNSGLVPNQQNLMDPMQQNAKRQKVDIQNFQSRPAMANSVARAKEDSKGYGLHLQNTRAGSKRRHSANSHNPSGTANSAPQPSTLQKRRQFKAVGPVSIPKKNDQAYIRQLTPPTANSTTGSMFVQPKSTGDSRMSERMSSENSAGSVGNNSAVLPSPSVYFASDTPNPQQEQGVSFTGPLPSLSPYGWGTPTHPNGRQMTFNKIPGHPDSATCSENANSTTTNANSTTTDSSKFDGNPGEPHQRGKSLSQRRGAQISSLNITSLAKPKSRVVEVAATDTPSLTQMQNKKNIFNPPSGRGGTLNSGGTLQSAMSSGVPGTGVLPAFTPPSRGGSILTPSLGNLMHGLPSPVRTGNSYLPSPRGKDVDALQTPATQGSEAASIKIEVNSTKCRPAESVETEGLHAIAEATINSSS